MQTARRAQNYFLWPAVATLVFLALSIGPLADALRAAIPQPLYYWLGVSLLYFMILYVFSRWYIRHRKTCLA